MSKFSISNHLVAGVFPDGLDLGELTGSFTEVGKAVPNGSLSNRYWEPRSLPYHVTAPPIVRTSDNIPSACLVAAVWG